MVLFYSFMCILMGNGKIAKSDEGDFKVEVEKLEVAFYPIIGVAEKKEDKEKWIGNWGIDDDKVTNHLSDLIIAFKGKNFPFWLGNWSVRFLEPKMVLHFSPVSDADSFFCAGSFQTKIGNNVRLLIGNDENYSPIITLSGLRYELNNSDDVIFSQIILTAFINEKFKDRFLLITKEVSEGSGPSFGFTLANGMDSFKKIFLNGALAYKTKKGYGAILAGNILFDDITEYNKNIYTVFAKFEAKNFSGGLRFGNLTNSVFAELNWYRFKISVQGGGIYKIAKEDGAEKLVHKGYFGVATIDWGVSKYFHLVHFIYGDTGQEFHLGLKFKIKLI